MNNLLFLQKELLDSEVCLQKRSTVSLTFGGKFCKTYNLNRDYAKYVKMLIQTWHVQLPAVSSIV